MGTQFDKRYGIGVSPGTGTIYVGLTASNNSDLLEKQDVTWEACKAVSQHLMIQESHRFMFQSDGKRYEMVIREFEPTPNNQTKELGDG